MTATQLYWTKGPWRGKLALAARPRGGDWLEDEIAGWNVAGVQTILSLLTPDEERDLALEHEAPEAAARGIKFLSFPIQDRDVPSSEQAFTRLIERLDGELSSGRNIVIHCRQGIGRTGLVAACLLVSKGLDAADVVHQLSEARGLTVPETAEQRRWIDHYSSLASVK